jgi:hypothetical protein
MDLWTYLRSFARWWWLALAFPVAGFLLAYVVLFPSAPYQASWTVFMGFNDNPGRANSFAYVDYIVLDDIGHLLQSDVAGDVIYLNLPESVTNAYTREEVGNMFSSFRHARFVEIFVTGDDPEVVRNVAETTEGILAMTVNEYLIPPDNPNYPGVVETMNPISEPERLTRERLKNTGAVTLASAALGLIAVGVAEWLRQVSRSNQGAR